MDKILALITPVVALMILLVNMVTEGIKKLFKSDKLNPQLVAFLLSAFLAISFGVGCGIYLGIDKWYLWAADLIISALVAFGVCQAAEAGYDGGYAKILDYAKELIQMLLGGAK